MRTSLSHFAIAALGMQAGLLANPQIYLMQKQKMQATVATFVSAWYCYKLSFEPNSAGSITFKTHKTTAGLSTYNIALNIGTRKGTCRNRPTVLCTTLAWFSSRIFLENGTAALSLLFSNECPIIV